MANNILILEFAAPSALDEEVTGVDRNSGVSNFVFRQANLIKDATHETDPAATISYTFLTRRGEITRDISVTAQMLRTTLPSSNLRPNMPIPLGGGQVEFRIKQTAGALTATNIVLTLQNPLAI